MAVEPAVSLVQVTLPLAGGDNSPQTPENRVFIVQITVNTVLRVLGLLEKSIHIFVHC